MYFHSTNGKFVIFDILIISLRMVTKHARVLEQKVVFYVYCFLMNSESVYNIVCAF